MIQLSTEEQAWLGTDPSSFHEELSLEPTPTAHALAREPVSFDAGFRPWMLADEQIPGVSFGRAVADVGFVRVAAPGWSIEAFRTPVVTEPEAVVVDVRHERNLVRLRRDHRTVVAVLRPGEGLSLLVSVEIQPVDRTRSAVSVPTLDELTRGFPVASWLAEQAQQRLDSVSSFERVAGVGLIARAWTAERGDVASVWERLHAGEADPTARARAWARGLSGDLAREILGLFERRQARYEGLVESLRDAYEGELDLAEVIAQTVEERDDLASVEWVLAQTPLRSEAEGQLAATDADAATHHLATELISDPALLDRLWAVAETEPERWWVRVLPGAR